MVEGEVVGVEEATTVEELALTLLTMLGKITICVEVVAVLP